MSLENTIFFEHLSPAQRSKIEKIGLVRHFGSDEIVFYEGDESGYFHFLMLGEVSVFKSSSSSEPIVIHRFRAPSLIAEVATLKQIPYPASCRTTAEATILKIPRESFLELLREDPSFGIALISSLTQKIGALEGALQRHNAPSAMAKVARLIRDERQVFHRLKGIEIAQMIGITPETLSRMIKILKTQKVIEVSKSDGLRLLDIEKLNGYCG